MTPDTAAHFPAWTVDAHGADLHLTQEDQAKGVLYSVAALVSRGWIAYDGVGPLAGPIDQGPERGIAGMDAAEKALRDAGMLAPGVVVRR